MKRAPSMMPLWTGERIAMRRSHHSRWSRRRALRDVDWGAAGRTTSQESHGIAAEKTRSQITRNTDASRSIADDHINNFLVFYTRATTTALNVERVGHEGVEMKLGGGGTNPETIKNIAGTTVAVRRGDRSPADGTRVRSDGCESFFKHLFVLRVHPLVHCHSHHTGPLSWVKTVTPDFRWKSHFKNIVLVF